MDCEKMKLYIRYLMCDRFFCCIPLRYGLILWAIIKMVFDCCVVGYVCRMLYNSWHPNAAVVILNVGFCLANIMAITDLVLNVKLIIGCVKLKLELLNLYHLYSKLLTALMISVYIIFSLFLTLHYIFSVCYYLHTKTQQLVCSGKQFTETAYYFAIIGVHLYITRLVRNEIVKYEDDDTDERKSNLIEPIGDQV